MGRLASVSQNWRETNTLKEIKRDHVDTAHVVGYLGEEHARGRRELMGHIKVCRWR